MKYCLFLLTASLALAAPRVVVIGEAKAPPGHEVIALPATDAQFPPVGVAYRENAAAHRIWRTIHSFAPDVVLTATPMPSLAMALSGQVPVVTELPRKIAPSPLAVERARRLRRTPREVADEMAKVYGHELKDVVYIPAFAVIARHRLGANVNDLLAPYLNGQKDSLAKATSSHFSGHLVFAAVGGGAAVGRVRAAADLAIAQRAMHNEMSDSVFMGCPLLARAGQLTGERRYYTAAADHLEFMQRLCLRPDGLYRHSPMNEAAWGRGNAFPALGMALMIAALPAAERAKPLADFRKLVDALLPHQTAQGMWRQVIDDRESYEEFSATAMIAAAMHQGLRQGWLKGAPYRRAVDRAWEGIKARTASDGKLMDVCESTGKQASLEDYRRRAAIWDRDPRGGAMALLLATELLAK
jgi:hypothetical protein